MRTLAVGDIHGCLKAFETLLELAEFGPDDQLVTLGDYVDRGPSSAGVLNRLIELHNQGQLIALLGNHDSMFLNSRHDLDRRERWLMLGGRETLRSYKLDPRDPEALEQIPSEHWQFLNERCQLYHESDTAIFVHGLVDPNLPMSEQEPSVLLWTRFYSPKAHRSGKRVICGHTSQGSGRPMDMGHSICIDTRVYGEGWLTAMDANTGELWQARENGETRRLPAAPWESS